MQFNINVYKGIIFVQSTEIEEEFSAFIYKNMQIGNKRISLYHIVKYAHTQIKQFICECNVSC